MYCLSSPESKYYRPQKNRKRFKRAYKVGSSWNLEKRINAYLLSFPFSQPYALELEGCVMLNLANTQREKVTIQSAEDYFHKQLHTHLGKDPRHYPGSEGSRLNQEKIEWYSDVGLEEIKGLLQHVAEHYGGVYAHGGEDWAAKWSAHQKKRRSWSYQIPPDFFPKKKAWKSK